MAGRSRASRPPVFGGDLCDLSDADVPLPKASTGLGGSGAEIDARAEMPTPIQGPIVRAVVGPARSRRTRAAPIAARGRTTKDDRDEQPTALAIDLTSEGDSSSDAIEATQPVERSRDGARSRSSRARRAPSVDEPAVISLLSPPASAGTRELAPSHASGGGLRSSSPLRTRLEPLLTVVPSAPVRLWLARAACAHGHHSPAAPAQQDHLPTQGTRPPLRPRHQAQLPVRTHGTPCVPEDRLPPHNAGPLLVAFCPSMLAVPGEPAPAAWEVVLLLDSREVCVSLCSALPGAHLCLQVRTREDRSFLESKLLELGIPTERRQLPLGDVLWIARPQHSSRAAGDDTAGSSAVHERRPRGAAESRRRAFAGDVVLPWVLERKRVDDLAASIVDGRSVGWVALVRMLADVADRRYGEQKLRLRQAAPWARVVYLVEGDPHSMQQRLVTPAALHTAMAATSAVSGFMVQQTRTPDETVAFLAALHREVEQHFMCALANGAESPPRREEERSKWYSYAEFAAQAIKPRIQSVGDAAAAMIRQIRGCSGPRAAAIAQRFRTIHSLASALLEVDASGPSADDMCASIAQLAVPGQRSSVGPALAAALSACIQGRGALPTAPSS